MGGYLTYLQSSMHPIRGILWDNDGVLVDTESLFYQANQRLFAEHDVELTHQHFFDWFLLENLGAWHILQARGYNEHTISSLRDQRNDYYAELLRSSTELLISAVKPAIERVSENLRMGIVTSSRRDHFDQIHERLRAQGHDLLRHFDFVVTESDYKESKPAPDPYLLGLQRINLDPADCIVIEDSPRGLRAALAAGLRCIVIRNAFCAGYDFPGAYKVLQNHTELESYLRSLL